MKTKIMKLSLLAGIALSLGSLFVSCDDQIKPDAPDTDEAGNVFTTTETVIPLRYTESEYKGGETGVSIKVTKATADELVFTCKPGLDIQSYLIQAYPMSFIYDTFMDNMVGEGKEKYTLTEVNDLLRTLITNMSDNNSTARGRLVNETHDGDEFYELEVDYMNTVEDRVFRIQPDMDYLIVAFASFNTNKELGGDAIFQDPADLCICHVRTEAREIDGNPNVTINVTPGFTTYTTEYIPNDDCQYFHYLTAPKASIDRYVNAFGDDMYCQLLCNIAGRIEKGSENSVYRSGTVADVEYTATAVALDKNGTSVREYNSKDFTLNDVPENTDKAEVTIDNPHRIGGSIVEFKIHMAKNCKDARYGIYPKATVDAIMKYTDEEKEAYAKAMCYPTEANPVWGITNRYYSYDLNNPDNPLATSQAMDADDYQWELAGDTEYRIIYAGYDRFNRPGELKATEAFKTKPLDEEHPELSKATDDLVMKIISTTRTSLTLHFEYNKENTALYYFQYYAPLPSTEAGHKFPTDKNDPNYRADWMYMFLRFKNPDPFQTPWPNVWRDEGDGKKVIDYPWSGFNPNTTYKFAYMGEDWDGVYGEVKFCEGTTLSINAGDNPLITSIDAKLDADGNYTVTYKANDETSEIRYMIVDENSAHYGPLGVKDFLRGDLSYEEVQEGWPPYICGSDAGLDTPNLEAIQTGKLEGKTTVVMAVALGATTPEGVAMSPVSALIILDKDGDGTIEQSDIQTLEEFCGVTAAKSNRATATVTLDTTPGVPMRFAVRPGNGAVRVKTF